VEAQYTFCHAGDFLCLHSCSGFKRLYIGVTTELEVRVLQHKNGSFPGSFTEKYNIKHLVYFERFADLHAAIAREKQLKRWSRVKKIRLIVGENPAWRDLSEGWGGPVEPFREEEVRRPVLFGERE
jgi:putative endonuclease